jgi:enoyl-CoA hydratase/carnithine racemase
LISKRPRRQSAQTGEQAYNAPAVKLAKCAVNTALETPLSEGLKQEHLYFQSAFATEGQKEGMNALVHERAPVFRNR